MITLKDIQIKQFDVDRWTYQVSASLHLTAARLMDKQAEAACNVDIRKDINNQLVYHLQQKLYGDAQKLISELEYVALSSCSKLDHATKLREDFAKLRDLLTIK